MGLIKKMNSHWSHLRPFLRIDAYVGADATLHLFGHFFLCWQRERLSANSRSNFLQYRILNRRGSTDANSTRLCYKLVR